jgi:hypothetical protein
MGMMIMPDLHEIKGIAICKVQRLFVRHMRVIQEIFVLFYIYKSGNLVLCSVHGYGSYFDRNLPLVEGLIIQSDPLGQSVKSRLYSHVE